MKKLLSLLTTIGIITLSFSFFITEAKSSLVTNPAYMHVPRNIYYPMHYSATHTQRNNITHRHRHRRRNSMTYNDVCKTPGQVKKIIIEKSFKTMYLLDSNRCIVKKFKNIRLGLNSGPKHCEGDKKTPEGIYHIIEKRDSKYVKFLAIDYPQAKDIRKAEELGCKPGDSIGIHSWIEGLPKEGSQGCITVWTKKDILLIDKLVSVGTEVEIKE